MSSTRLLLLITLASLSSCAARPTVVVSGSLGRHALKGKTLAVGGFTAQCIMDYPGQAAEETIVNDAGTTLQRRFKHERVLTAEALWAAAGAPPVKVGTEVPITIGHRLTREFMKRTHAQGVDYLLWIELMDNSVRNSSSQSISTKRTSSSTYTSRSGKRYTSPGSTSRTYYSYAAAGRSLGVSYSLLDTASGQAVWRADAKYSRAKISGKASISGFPTAPSAPLPPEESVLIRKMTAAAIAGLPN